MTEANGWIELVKWLGQAVVVGFGWTVVHRLSAQRDRDKARREMIAKTADELSDVVSALISDAREYHLAARDLKLELNIKMTLQDLAMRVQGLSDICAEEKALAPCRAEVAALRRAVTGNHFEDEHLGPLSESSEQFESIADVALRAKRRLLTLKHLQFPGKSAR